MTETLFSLNPELDLDQLAQQFGSAGRVHIPDFLAQKGAEQLFSDLRARDDWRLVINQGEKLFELDRKAQEALSPDERAKLDLAVYQAARTGFQFRFETIRVPDSEAERVAEPTLLNNFARFLSSEATIDTLRRITGCAGIGFADAQATAYGPGHFLTAHDDDVGGKGRLAAYVFNLTPRWRVEWGGLLMFHRSDGHVGEGYLPRFNALNLFKVPQLHSVSYVVPFVPNRRYAVTGWLRSGKPAAKG
jgi:SM-20-related protein